MLYAEPNDSRHLQILTAEESVHQLLSIQKHRKINNISLGQPQKVIKLRWQHFPRHLQIVQSSHRQVALKRQKQPLFNPRVRRLIRWVQNERSGPLPRGYNPQLPVRSEARTRGVDDPDPADSRLPLIVDSDQEGCLWEADQGASTETTQVQIQQVQYWQGVRLIFACCML